LEFPTLLINEKFVNVMESVNLSCKVSGAPSLSVNWSYPISDDRVNIRTNRNGDEINSILTIQLVTFNDTGEYVCSASTPGLTGHVVYSLTVGK